MKIAIEAQRIFRKNKHGMDFVVLETIRSLQKIDKNNEYFIFTAKGEDACLQESDNFHIIEIKCPTYPLWEQIALPRAVKKIRPDILHCTSNTAPVFYNAPLVVTLHDIIFLEKKTSRNKSVYQNFGRLYRRLVVPLILKKCKKIITVSKYEKERIISALNLPEEKIEAILNGYNTYFKKVENYYETTSKYLKEDGYFFFLGNTDPKKNTAGTLKAYSLYLEKSSFKRTLLIADIKESVVDYILQTNGIKHIKPYLRLSGYISNKDLPAIYSGSFAFLYTSFRESFGIPLLEGMACGTPVITSGTSAIPEVAGERALLTDPYDPQSIADAMIKLEEDNLFRKNIIEYGIQRVRLFSWDITAESLLRLYYTVK